MFISITTKIVLVSSDYTEAIFVWTVQPEIPRAYTLGFERPKNRFLQCPPLSFPLPFS